MSSQSSLSQRGRRFIGLAGIATRRLVVKLRVTQSRRVAMSLAGVALAIALTIVVTGVALQLSTHSTVGSDDVDYWIVPEEGSASTMVVSTGGPQFGQVHPTAERLNAHPEIRLATPVLVEMLRIGSPDGAPEFVLTIGVVPTPDLSVAGVPTDSLTPGDPYYANGSYNGTWTGEMVLSGAAADVLNASTGTQLQAFTSGRDSPSVTVTATPEGGPATGFGQVPVAVVHLAELQELTGATSGDQADQLLVSTNSKAAKPTLEAVYPNSVVISRTGLASGTPSSGLPMAMSLTAALVGLVVGTLFIATTMGLEITADQRTFGLLGAIGLSWRSRAVIVLTQILLVTLWGGLLGVVLGLLGIELTNMLAAQYFIERQIATSDPLLVGYGLAIALLIGTVALPYLLWLTRRASVLEQLQR